MYKPEKFFVILFLLSVFSIIDISASIDNFCPRILHHVFKGYAPVGKNKTGNFTEHPELNNLLTCIQDCCKKGNDCNAAFIYNLTCFHVKCASNELCLPQKTLNLQDKLQMVLVTPVNENDPSWREILSNSQLTDFDSRDPKYDFSAVSGAGNNEIYNNPYSEDKISYLDRALASDLNYLNDDSDLQMEESRIYPEKILPCESGMDAMCPDNEECYPLLKSRQGICKCVSNFIRNEYGKCIKSDSSYQENILMNTYNEVMDAGSKAETSSVPSVSRLTVSVISKTVQLPTKEVTLSVYVVPDEQSSGNKYSYLWTLISQPMGDSNGTMTDQTKDKVKLSNLAEGLYKFKVAVTGSGSTGEAYANVTILPEKRINKSPEVIITPQQQTVKLPNSGAILDGSTSIDDDTIIKWHWELVQGPIGYQPKLPETSTLQLTDLTSPGNYTFKLTVTDSDHAENSTTANISVLKSMDYPPEANAGPDVIMYLPHNNVTLNGSLSTDDREIVAWEWTKDANDESKAIDMQNTRTPFLLLSNLAEGIYTFVLKVTDASGQISSANVHVFVKQPTNLPPVANAGQNSTINLPKNWVTLNGSSSSDDIKIIGYYWKQLSGPTNSIIGNANASIANATAMTIGQYTFELTVIDENNNNGTDKVVITIVQERNAAPIANAGGDQSVTLPVSVIKLNGTNSSDDLGIVNYEWTRESGSLAVGTIVGNSSHQPVLMLTNVVAGRYVFQLKVKDDQGMTGTDTVSIIVHPDPLILNLVELTLTMEARFLTQSELDSLQQKLVLLLGDDTKFYMRDLRIEQKTHETVIIFYVEKLNANGKTQIMPGVEVEKSLREKFWRDAGILGTSISDIRTSVCQNPCSNHGICNPETRSCLCETFWMPDIFYFWGVSEANCDWSILYVIIGVFIGFLLLSGFFWGISCLCRRSYKPKTRSKPQKYALIGSHEEDLPSYVRGGGGTTISDSETDSDVLFESRTKQNGILRSSNGDAKNGGHKVTRMGRRIKT